MYVSFLFNKETSEVTQADFNTTFIHFLLYKKYLGHIFLIPNRIFKGSISPQDF